MALLFPPGYRATDANGDPLSGALLYLYESGGLVLTPGYTTSTLDTEHENPVEADGNGLFPAIYLDDATSYRAVLKTAAGALIDDLDPVIGSGTTNAATFRPDAYGAIGDGVTNDHLALGALADAVEAAGGGLVEFTPGATYIVGKQDTGGTYYLTPPPLLEFKNCTKRIIIRGNGAKLKCAAGLKYGTFDPATGLVRSPNTLPFNNVAWITTPYLWMFKFENCTGGVEFDGMELDGNIQNQVIGAGYDNQGTQIAMIGIGVYGDHGPLDFSNIDTHHHGMDGWFLDGPDATLPTKGGRFENVISHHNGRQGLSLVGGGDYVFNRCDFTLTGYDLGSLTYSPPGAGIDIEAESGKKVRRIVFNDCVAAENVGVGLLASQGDSAEVTWLGGKLSGDYNWAVWPAKPYYHFGGRVEIVGPVVNIYNGTTTAPASAATFEDYTITNDVTRAPSGQTYSPAAGNILFSGGGGIHRRGLMIHAIAGTGTQGVLDSTRYEDYTIVARAGTVTNYGRYAGRCNFIEDGGTIGGYPGPPAGSPLNDVGEAEDRFTYRTGGTTVTLLSTAERSFQLTDGATITPNFNFRRNFYVTLAGNRTLANPTNMKEGAAGFIRVIQDGTGNRTLAYGSVWKLPGGAPTLSTAAGAVDVIEYYVRNSTTIEATIAKAFA